jgi:hypothetical protein
MYAGTVEAVFSKNNLMFDISNQGKTYQDGHGNTIKTGTADNTQFVQLDMEDTSTVSVVIKKNQYSRTPDFRMPF